MWWPAVRERLLTRHFLQRFLENDLLSPEADRHDAIAMACGGLLTLGLFLSVVISLKFLFMPFQSPGRTALPGVGDRLTFISISMIVMALVAVMTWDALSLDPRDTAIFGPLPIARQRHRPGQAARRRHPRRRIRAGTEQPLERVPSDPDGHQAADRPDRRVRAGRHSPGGHARGRPLRFRLDRDAAGGVARLARETFQQDFGGLQAVLIVALVASFLLLPAHPDWAGTAGTANVRLLPPVLVRSACANLAGDLGHQLARRRAARRHCAGGASRRGATGGIAVVITPLAGALSRLWHCPDDCSGRGVFLKELQAAAFTAASVARKAPRTRAASLASSCVQSAPRPAEQAGLLRCHCMFRSARIASSSRLGRVDRTLWTVSLGAGSRAQARACGASPSTSSRLMAHAGGSCWRDSATCRASADDRRNRLVRLAWVAEDSAAPAGVSGVAVRRSVLRDPAPPAAVSYLLGARLALVHALSGVLAARRPFR